ncbi:MAG: HD domain-containing protein, partial [Methanomassiliicoccales archaeon]
MSQEKKVVHDAVHGSVVFSEPFDRLLETPEMQRMAHIRQLGLAYLVFPGANHTRFEHMIGAYHLASRFATVLGLEGWERDMLLTSALVHDAGHPPFSHTLEPLMMERLGMNHMELTASIIKGERDVVPKEQGVFLSTKVRLKEAIESISLDPDQVAQVVMREEGVPGVPSFISSLIHGPVDVDQLDYLMRDAHYTGVASGRVDGDRIIQTTELNNGRLVLRKSGVPAVEGLIVSRILMNTAVYFHKTVRIAEMMLLRAASFLDDSSLAAAITGTDASLEGMLLEKGGEARKLMTMLKYRQLYKPAFSVSLHELDSSRRTLLSSMIRDGTKHMEDEICRLASVPKGSVLVDASQPEYLEGDAVPGKTAVPVMDDTVV